MTQTALELRHWQLFKNREDKLQNSLRETTGRAYGLSNARGEWLESKNPPASGLGDLLDVFTTVGNAKDETILGKESL